MSDFDDLFDRGIPREEAFEAVRELGKFVTHAFAPTSKVAQADHLIKEAVTAGWVADTVRSAAQRVPMSRLDEAASGSMKNVLNAVKQKKRLGQAAVDKRMALHQALQGAQVRRSTVPPLPKVAQEKQAVTTGWVANAARGAARNLPDARLSQAAGSSMKNVLNTLKRKRTLGQGAVDKRMAVHNALQAATASRVSNFPAGMKAASDKTAISTQFMARAARNASPERIMQARNASLNAGHQLAQRGTGSLSDAMSYRNRQRFASVLDNTLQRKTGADMKFDNRTLQRLHREAQKEPSAAMNTAAGAISGAIGGMAIAAMVAPDKYQRAAAVGSLIGAARGLAQATLTKRSADEMPMPAPGEPAPEAVIMAEQQGLLDQTAAENEALRDELAASQDMATQHAAAAEQAAVQAQQLQQQLAEAQQASEALQAQAAQQMQMVQAQQQEAQMQAQLQAQQAAQHADAKMRLSIRIQQMRQQLAQMASQDPVSEEGEQPQGAVQTPQQQAADAAAQQQGMVAPEAAQAPEAQAPTAQAPQAPQAPKTAALVKAARQRKLAVALAPKATGLKRVGQLFSGSHLKQLQGANQQAARAAGEAFEDKVIAQSIHTKNPSDETWKSLLKARETHGQRGDARDAARDALNTEGLKVFGTRGGATALGVGGAYAGAKVLGGRRRQKQASDEDPLRRRARNAATIHGVLPGAAAGLGTAEAARAVKNMFAEKKVPLGHGARAGATLLGAAALGLHGRTGFNKRELAKDLGALRALQKEHTGRQIKAFEKEASEGLTDDQIDRLYGL